MLWRLTNEEGSTDGDVPEEDVDEDSGIGRYAVGV